MTDRCEPPPELQASKGWYWLRRQLAKYPIRWTGRDWDMPLRHPEDAYERGWRYLSPVATPAEVEALRAERDALAAERDALWAAADSASRHLQGEELAGAFVVLEAIRARAQELEKARDDLSARLIRENACAIEWRDIATTLRARVEELEKVVALYQAEVGAFTGRGTTLARLMEIDGLARASLSAETP